MNENTSELLNFKEQQRELKDYYLSFLEYLKEDSNIQKFSSRKATLRDICCELDAEVPERFEDIADDKMKIKFRSEYVSAGDVCLILRSAEEFEMKRTTSKDMYDLAMERGAKLVIMGKDDFEKSDINEEESSVILVDNINERILKMFAKVRAQHHEKMVMITGSVGKTTTKELCDVVTKNRFQTFVNAGNTNSVHKVAAHLFYKVNKNREVYIQEAGAGYVGSVTLAGAMMQPDIFILTNVYKHHMENYGTLANVFFDKTGADEFMAKDGIIITNFDDENIRNYPFKHKVVSFAIQCEDADYRAVNIKQSMDCLSCDIYEKATGKSAGIEVKISGEHNIYNILAAYVLGKTLGLSDDVIKEDFLSYRTDGIRQNLSNVGGTYFNVDCYNVAEESILAMLRSGEKMELPEGGRRIAVIGGENKLGSEASKRSEAFGRKLADIHVDRYLFCGVNAESEKAYNKYGDGKSIRKGFQEVSKTPNEYSWKIPNIVAFLKKNVKRGDLVMLKGIYHLNMTIAVDKVFGTSYSFKLPHFRETTSIIKENGYEASLIEKFKQLQLLAAPVIGGKVTIPGKISGHPVFRIKEEVFKGNEKIETVNFGSSMKNIGAGAFAQCKNLKELLIPWNVKVIEAQAFAACEKLSKVEMQDGVTHIAEKAFADCKNLTSIFIPETVGMIEEEAFAGCEQLVIGCVENSFAHQYALEHKMNFELQNPRSDKVINLMKEKWMKLKLR